MINLVRIGFVFIIFAFIALVFIFMFFYLEHIASDYPFYFTKDYEMVFYSDLFSDLGSYLACISPFVLLGFYVQSKFFPFVCVR